jgi:uncharacterized membrane protein YfcA
MLYEILFFISAFISEIIGTIAGFGSSTIFLPLALFFVDFKTALVLVAIFHLFGNLGRINFFRHGLDRKIIIIFGIPSILLSFLGASLVGILSQDILKVILGIFLIVISISFLFKPALKFPTNLWTVISGGGISGFITGLVGTGGALRALGKDKIHSNSSCYSTGNRCHKNSIIYFSRFSNRAVLLLHTNPICCCDRRFIYWKEDSQ